MTVLMEQEMQALFYSFCGGWAVMLLFQVGGLLCSRCRSYPRLYCVLFLFFWVIASFLCYQFAYRGAYGCVSWYSLIAFGFAILLWRKGFCDIITLYDTVQKQTGDIKHEKKEKRTHTKVRNTKGK